MWGGGAGDAEKEAKCNAMYTATTDVHKSRGRLVPFGKGQLSQSGRPKEGLISLTEGGRGQDAPKKALFSNGGPGTGDAPKKAFFPKRGGAGEGC